jgi:exodeoxyribonuclease-3
MVRKKKMSLKIISWNVNGLRSAEKKGFWGKIKELDPDIVCLQEIKAKPEQLSLAMRKPEGWYAYFFPAQRPGYSGVAVYSKKQPLKVHYGLGDDRFDAEGRVLVLVFAEFVLVNAYFPNGGRDDERLKFKLDFCEVIQEFLLGFSQPVFLGGDINTAHQERDLARPRENVKNSGFLPVERAWLDRFIAAGFVDSFRVFHTEGENYSWWDMKTRARERNVGWRIDYFFVSAGCEKYLQDAFILPEVMGSDHCPVGIEVVF